MYMFWHTLSLVRYMQKLDAGSQLTLIDDLHRDIRAAAAEVKGEHLPGFCLPKKVQTTLLMFWVMFYVSTFRISLLLFLPQGVTCILPVLREGVLTGSPEQKEEAARALGAVIKLTSAEALRPSVVNITGPLIRILGDRFAWTVKTALLETLTLLLLKVFALL